MDFRLYQSVRETRRIAADREGAGWQRLRDALDALSDRLGVSSDDVAFDREADRLDRGQLHEDPWDHVAAGAAPDDADLRRTAMAALYAVHDDPSDARAAAAAAVLDRLGESLA